VTRRTFVFLLAFALAFCTTACDRQAPPPKAPPPTDTRKQDCDDDHEHGAAGVVELGTSSCGPFTVKASRDKRTVKPGCDAPIDVWVSGSKARVTVVRFWVGTADAKGSIKARADVENPLEPDHWHAHAEVPDPIPSGSKVWIEIEAEGGVKATCSFDLKA
jgi:hypothetical protein